MFSSEYPINGDSTCGKRTRSRHLRKHVAVVIALCFAAGSFAACGGSGSASSVNDPTLDNQTNYTSQYETEWRQLFNSKHYSGYIAVKFKDDTEMRLRAGSLVSTKSIDGARAEPVREAIVRHGAQAERMLPMPEEKIERALERAKREGRKLHDWNLYYKIEVKSPGHAEELFKELRDLDSVEYIQPMPIPYVADVGDIPGGGGPGSVTEQLYLDTHAATGGLNVYAAWNQGIYGQNVRISDSECNWNFGHEDLGISEDDIIAEANIYPDGFDINDPIYINHGTAVAGVIRGIDNDTGVDGIASQSELKFFRVFSSADATQYLMSKLEDYVELDSETPPPQRPGDIVLIEIQLPGPLTPPDTGCAVDMVTQEPTWCLPLEAYYYSFHGIQDITELGYIVVEGAGNGGIDLANPNARATSCGSQECPDLSTDDAGAIMVAASNGQTDLNKPFWSNWGARMNAYAWGYDVVTAGYGDHPMSDPADPNKWYTTDFNGTSSAGALVAGAVALVQSYVKDLYRELYPHKQFYIDAYQMRDLINAAGHDGDPVFSIGKKPDVGAMMGMIADGDVLPHVVPDNPAFTPRQQVIAGVRYDMDRDGRDELIVLDEGAWKIDRSDIAASGPDPHPDNFGEWDLILNVSGLDPDGIYFPVVSDYDSDGDADLAVYDNKNGIWYVKFTTQDLLNLPLDTEIDWDLEIDYSADPLWKPFSRPVAADFDGDLYLDLAIITGDGHFIIDYGGIGRIEKIGGDLVYVSDFEGFENDVTFLTPEQLAEAPGWAYLAQVYEFGGNEDIFELVFKAPAGPDEGRIFKIQAPAFDTIKKMTYNYFEGNEYQLIPFNASNGSAHEVWFREVGGAGDWRSMGYLAGFNIDLSEPSWSSNDSCMPVAGDYDGDGLSEFSFICPDGFQISYYDREVGSPPIYTYLEDRVVNLDISPLALPPTVHSGGMAYDNIKSILEYYDLWDDYQDKDPFGPHTVQCINYWAPPPTHCIAK